MSRLLEEKMTLINLEIFQNNIRLDHYTERIEYLMMVNAPNETVNRIRRIIRGLERENDKLR